eukprot:scaffold2536_cov169-Amphora_coffeaeformis.AAC.20
MVPVHDCDELITVPLLPDSRGLCRFHFRECLTDVASQYHTMPRGRQRQQRDQAEQTHKERRVSFVSVNIIRNQIIGAGGAIAMVQQLVLFRMQMMKRRAFEVPVKR